MQQQELAQMRQRDANLTALAAIGPRKKRKRKVASQGPGSGAEGTRDFLFNASDSSLWSSESQSLLESSGMVRGAAFPRVLHVDGGQRVFEHWAQLAVVTGHTLERAPVTSCVQTLPGLFHSRVCFLAPVQLISLVCGAPWVLCLVNVLWVLENKVASQDRGGLHVSFDLRQGCCLVLFPSAQKRLCSSHES
ncbi:hypothetical protein CB1_000243026 [Camelus ferus]|nr:hypothetical protein CB1_000243026 [Camelus ferus]